MDLPIPTLGRVVYYVLGEDEPRAGDIRPALIVRVNPDTVNLAVQLDGPNDGATEHRTQNSRWVGSARLDQEGKKPGTWHWMPYQIAPKPYRNAVPETTTPPESTIELEPTPVTG